jgi:hypothetical protein
MTVSASLDDEEAVGSFEVEEHAASAPTPARRRERRIRVRERTSMGLTSIERRALVEGHRTARPVRVIAPPIRRCPTARLLLLTS